MSHPGESKPLLLEVKNIGKDYPGVRALDNVNFDVPAEMFTVWLAKTGPEYPR
jgi:ABC-type sugar transport system ATPase subunit